MSPTAAAVPMTEASVYNVEDDLVFVSVPVGQYAIEGEGVYADVKWAAGQETGIIIDKENLSKLRKVVRIRSTFKYRNIDSGEQLSAAEYNKQLGEIVKNAKLDDRGNYVFESSREKFLFQCFKNEWAPMESEEIFYEKLHFVFKDDKYHEHPYIVHNAKLGGKLASTLYTYKAQAHIIGVIRELFKQFGYEERLDFPSKSITSNNGELPKYFVIKDGSIKYSTYTDIAQGKLNEYLTIAISGLKRFENLPNSTGTFEKLVEAFNKNDAELRGMVTAFLARDLKLNQVVSEPTLLSMRDSIVAALEEISAPKAKTNIVDRLWTSLTKIKEDLDRSISGPR